MTTEVDPETGDITHIFKAIPKPTTPPPVTPPLVPPVTPQPPNQTTPVVKVDILPETGEVDSTVAATLGLLALTGATGLSLKIRRKEDN